MVLVADTFREAAVDRSAAVAEDKNLLVGVGGMIHQVAVRKFVSRHNKAVDMFLEENNDLLMAEGMIPEAVADTFPRNDIPVWEVVGHKDVRLEVAVRRGDEDMDRMVPLDGRLQMAADTDDTAHHLIRGTVSASSLLAIPIDLARDDSYIHQPAVSPRAKALDRAESPDTDLRQAPLSYISPYQAENDVVRLPNFHPAFSLART